MAEPQLKSRLRALMQEAVEAAKEANLSLLRGQRAVAIYNTERDDRVTALPSFAGAADELGSDPQFVAAAGRESASRVVLQLTYDYLERLRTDDFDEAAFEATWTSFSEELAKPNWTYLSMANLDGFKRVTLMCWSWEMVFLLRAVPSFACARWDGATLSLKSSWRIGVAAVASMSLSYERNSVRSPTI